MEELDQNVRICQLLFRMQNNLCLECGTAENVMRTLCSTCRQLPRYQEILSMKISFEPKYYLVVGSDSRAEKLRDCLSDHIELAEYEAEKVLKGLRVKGDGTSIVCVVEAETRLVVYRIK